MNLNIMSTDITTNTKPIYTDIDDLVKQIHLYNKQNNQRFVIAVTGGGISCLSLLFGQPGASSSILECTVPYACESTLEYTGMKEIKSWSSGPTATLLADGAFSRCNKLIEASESNYTPIAIGATGNLVSGENLKKGVQGIYVACKTNKKTYEVHLILHKGEKGLDGEKDKHFRTRQEEDDLCGKLIVCVCACECGLLDPNELGNFMNLNGMDSRDALYMYYTGKPSLKN